MINVEIQELTKGFSVSYFDDKEPSEMDASNVYCESWDAIQEFLKEKFDKTLKWRANEE